MPELPEVEHVVRFLGTTVTGRRVTSVELVDARSAHRPAARVRLPGIVGARVASVRRRAKLVLLELEGRRLSADVLVFHLMLTGKLRVQPREAPRSRWTRLTVALDDELEVRFEDTRRFGWFDLLDGEGVRALEAPLGPEPLEVAFTPEVFAARLAGRRGILKPLLLDQGFVAGIGNIYADEILHVARLHPLAEVQGLDTRSIRRLHRAIVSVLAWAVSRRTGIPSQERVGQGSRTASRELPLAVFQRTGEPCPRCGTAILRSIVRGRGTHTCPRCQPLSPARGSQRRAVSGRPRARRRG